MIEVEVDLVVDFDFPINAREKRSSPMTTRIAVVVAVCILVAALILYKRMGHLQDGRHFSEFALAFARTMSRREYEAAYAMTSPEYRASTPQSEMVANFERIIPRDWGEVSPIEVGLTQVFWRGKQPGDVGWAYVSLGGKVYSEALIVVVAESDGKSVIRLVEWGRP